MFRFEHPIVGIVHLKVDKPANTIADSDQTFDPVLRGQSAVELFHNRIGAEIDLAVDSGVGEVPHFRISGDHRRIVILDCIFFTFDFRDMTVDIRDRLG